jgi:hypothetical protein
MFNTKLSIWLSLWVDYCTYLHNGLVGQYLIVIRHECY